ncbi:MAG: hypothetical protein H7Z21_11815 [Hymenobacter sp.]|nr:hypothetical protein [Hymenobacter sp.]
MHKGRWLLLGTLALAACGPEDAPVRSTPANRKPGYFDVKGFLDAQVVALSRRQPVVEKQVRLRGGQLETTRVTKTDWSKELQIFYQADINKPALRGAYEAVRQNLPASVSRIVYQVNGNGTIKTSVDRLSVETRANRPQLVAATVRQDNSLFYSEKKLLLSVRNGQLISYEVHGVQKLVLFDTVRYSVRTRVLE